MEITYQTFLIVCPFLFLAGLIDAIGGGGGLISLPAYLIAGLPPHTAIATNKMSSTCGTTLATYRFIKNGLVNFKLAVPAIIAAIIGSTIGANISLLVSDDIMLYVMIAILPICAFLVLNKKLFHDGGSDDIVLNKKLYFVATLSAFIIGMYDGFYGPGTGTFLIIAFTSVKEQNCSIYFETRMSKSYIHFFQRNTSVPMELLQLLHVHINSRAFIIIKSIYSL